MPHNHTSWWATASFLRHASKVVSFPLAQTGEGISECELVSWSVKEGDTVHQFDRLCEVQSDKANIEITSRYNGKIVLLHHAPGAVVKVGAALLDIEVSEEEAELAAPAATAAAAGANPSNAPATSAGAPPPPPPLLTLTPPPAAPLMRSAAVAVASMVPDAAGATVVAVSAQPPTSPEAASTEPISIATSPLTAAAVAMTLSTAPATSSPAALAASGGAPPAAASVHASPSVRALAKSLGVDLASVRGTGPGGRITKEDLTRVQEGDAAPGTAGHVVVAAGAAARAQAGGGSQHATGSAGHPRQQLSAADALAAYQKLVARQQPQPQVQGGAAAPAPVHTVQPIKGYRRAMLKSMTAAAAIPHFHFCDEVHMDRLLQLRAALRDDPALQALPGHKLTPLPFIIKALSAALAAHPHINASLAASGQELLLHRNHNVGVAMATPLGLVVPNIKEVQCKSVLQISQELALLQQLAAAGKLPGEALSGGTITISNIGTIGGTYATPLVNPPEAAIVALGRIQQLPRYAAAHPGGAAAATPTSLMPVSWGADHRFVDGASLAAFSNAWKAFLEEPARLLLHTV